ncbi:MAG: hypothetical protein M3Q03_13755 [Chloroflexota bacterium]|nr:hypothetical protein [Chloroflexota bacterium]
MSDGQNTYGVSNLEYDLITTLSNLLQGSEALHKYAQDAEQAGDSECATLFRTLMDNNRASAQQFRSALQRQLSGGQ